MSISTIYILGVWLHPNGTAGCSPRTGTCYYDPQGENDQVHCSLGYMPFLENVKVIFLVLSLSLYLSLSLSTVSID